MNGEVAFTLAAEREFFRLESTVQDRVSAKVDDLERLGPLLSGVKQLHGVKRIYRLRVGSWRIVYQVDFERRVITIASIAHRSRVYR